MRPYIGYYINDIASPANNAAEAIWSVTLLTYVYFYHFDSVPVLFKEFGHDVLPDGDQFNAYVKAAGDRAKIARQLQDAARTESQAANRLLQG
jgi:hypothetical protein